MRTRLFTFVFLPLCLAMAVGLFAANAGTARAQEPFVDLAVTVGADNRGLPEVKVSNHGTETAYGVRVEIEHPPYGVSATPGTPPVGAFAYPDDNPSKTIWEVGPLSGGSTVSDVIIGPAGFPRDGRGGRGEPGDFVKIFVTVTHDFPAETDSDLGNNYVEYYFGEVGIFDGYAVRARTSVEARIIGDTTSLQPGDDIMFEIKVNYEENDLILGIIDDAVVNIQLPANFQHREHNVVSSSDEVEETEYVDAGGSGAAKWKLGDLVAAGKRSLTLTLTVTLTSEIVIGEHCLIAELSGTPHAGTQVARADNVSVSCVEAPSPTILSDGEVSLLTWYDCAGETAYPCDSANNANQDGFEIVVVPGRVGSSTISPAAAVQPGDVLIHVPEPLGRLTSDNSVFWSTGRGGLSPAGVRIGFTSNLDTSVWGVESGGFYTAMQRASYSGPGTLDLKYVFDDDQHSVFTFDANKVASPVVEYFGHMDYLLFFEFSALGTYRFIYTAEANHRSGTDHDDDDDVTHSDTETYTFYVGPMADLAVQSVWQTAQGVTVAVVNHGPDPSPGARVKLDTGESCAIGPIPVLGEGKHPEVLICTIFGAQLGDGQGTVTIVDDVPFEACAEHHWHLPEPISEAYTDATKSGECKGNDVTWLSADMYDPNPNNDSSGLLDTAPIPQGVRAQARQTTMPVDGQSVSKVIHSQSVSWEPLEELYGFRVTHYEVERLDPANNRWQAVGVVSESPYDDTDEDRGSSPRYRVRAVNVKGQWGLWSETGASGTGGLPRVTLALDPATIKEPDVDAPNAVSAATVTATLNRASAQNIEVVVSAAPASGNNPAEAGDYTLSENTTLSIPAGQRESTGVVTITANMDDDGENERVAVMAVAAHAAGGITPLTLTIQDDDAPGLTLLPASGITVVEGGGNDTYTVKLDAQPSGAVVVDITSDNPDVTAQSSTLTFQPETWNDPLTVTVSAGHDDDAADDEFTLIHSINRSRSAPEYHSAAAAKVTGTVMDIDTAGTMVSETRLTVAEGGGGSRYTVKLDTQPAGSVVVTASSDNPDVRVSPASFTLHGNNWEQGYTVRVSADHDEDGAPDTATIRHAIDTGRTTAGEYHGVLVDSVSVTVTDDDAPGVWVSPETLRIDEGRSGSYNVRLNTQPSDDVTITVSSSNGDVTVSPATLTFTSTDWNRTQRVTVNAADDADSANDRATLSHTMDSDTDTAYNGMSGATVAVTVTDADRPGVTVSPLSPAPVFESGRLVELTEGEGDERVSHGRERIDEAHQDFRDEQHPSFYTVGLDTQPSGDVVIDLQSSNNKVTVWPTSLRFTSGDFGAKTVRLTAADDEDSNDETATITHTVNAGQSADEYDNVRVDRVDVTVADNDDHGVTLLADYRDNGSRVEVIQPLVLREGETGQYSVVLDSQPDGHVWVEIKPSNPDKVSVSPSGLLFSGIQLHNGRIHPDWDEPQTVTVTARNDDDAADETVTLTHQIGDTNATQGTWDLPVGTRVGTVTVTVDDDDGSAQSRTASGGQSANAGYAWAWGEAGWGWGGQRAGVLYRVALHV